MQEQGKTTLKNQQERRKDLVSHHMEISADMQDKQNGSVQNHIAGKISLGTM